MQSPIIVLFLYFISIDYFFDFFRFCYAIKILSF